MSNLYSTAAQNLSMKATEAMMTVLAPFQKIARAFPLTDPKAIPAAGQVVPFVSAVSATQAGPNPDYTAGDATIKPIQVGHTLFSQVFGIANDELNQGARLNWLATLNGQQFAYAISDALTVLLKTDYFGAPLVTVTSDNFATGHLETLLAAVPTPDRCVVLNSPYFNKVKPQTWLPPNFTNCLEHTRWTLAGPNVQGFVGDPRAIVVSYAKPQIQALGREVMAESIMIIPQLGLEASATIYFLTATRQLRGCFSVYMGAAPANTTALKLLTSA